ncbi:cytochrome C oxidase subunit IV family protein [Pedobacter sp. SYSU D00535]|uniref:cytochrome C oxidase subunit IV family protein n=1 Tax=Pedobacter sp. SYSU D00535 TaxID=2810308 RepID=UPI001A96FDF8|nr:cytochrome C oxidase subunit IV family protein [Pedobacter sp. SYSU D00535]
MAEHTHSHDNGHDEHASMSKKKIWQVFFYLLGITALEFFIALVVIPKFGMSQGVANFIYIVLTLWKAFYIVAYFMHLKFEKYAFISSIVVSLVFIVYFIVLMLTEGAYLHTHMPR